MMHLLWCIYRLHWKRPNHWMTRTVGIGWERQPCSMETTRSWRWPIRGLRILTNSASSISSPEILRNCARWWRLVSRFFILWNSLHYEQLKNYVKLVENWCLIEAALFSCKRFISFFYAYWPWRPLQRLVCELLAASLYVAKRIQNLSVESYVEFVIDDCISDDWSCWLDLQRRFARTRAVSSRLLSIWVMWRNVSRSSSHVDRVSDDNLNIHL